MPATLGLLDTHILSGLIICAIGGNAIKKRIAETISIVQLMEMFDTEAKTVEWLEQVRWGGKPACQYRVNNTQLCQSKNGQF